MKIQWDDTESTQHSKLRESAVIILLPVFESLLLGYFRTGVPGKEHPGPCQEAPETVAWLPRSWATRPEGPGDPSLILAAA